MQNSSEFQFLTVDTIHESSTNPRETFDEAKLPELADNIRHNGLIQESTTSQKGHLYGQNRTDVRSARSRINIASL